MFVNPLQLEVDRAEAERRAEKNRQAQQLREELKQPKAERPSRRNR